MASVKVTRLTAADARPNDVVMTADGSVCQYGGEGQWSQMELVLTESGQSGHRSELTLLVRGGRPQVATAAP